MRRLAHMIALLTAFLVTTLPAPARGAAETGGAKRRISREALRDALERQTHGGPVVANLVVKGEDLIALLQGEVPVRVENCIVEDGLVFRESRVITVDVALIDCELKPTASGTRLRWGDHAIYAEGTQFSGKVDFSGTIFTGHADFTTAKFEKQATFSGAQFRRSAAFASTTFDALALFTRASFEHAIQIGHANGISSPAPPERNPENTRFPLAAPTAPPARDGCLRKRRTARRGAAERGLDMPLRMG